MSLLNNSPALKTLLTSNQTERKHLIKEMETPQLVDLFNQIQSDLKFSKRRILLLVDNLRMTIKLKPNDLELEALSKLILKLAMETCSKGLSSVPSVSHSFSRLFSVLEKRSKAFVKLLKPALHKMSFKLLNSFAQMLSKLSDKELTQAIAERLVDETDKLDSHFQPWNPNLFLVLQSSDLMSVFFERLRDKLRQSLSCMRQMAAVFRDFPIDRFTHHSKINDVFDVTFTDVFSTGDQSLAHLLSLAGSLLAFNTALLPDSKMEHFLSTLSHQMRKVTDSDLHLSFTQLVSKLHFTFSQQVETTVLFQLVDSLSKVKQVSDCDVVVKQLTANETFRGIKSFSVLCDNRLHTDHPSLVYALSTAVSDLGSYPSALAQFHSSNKDSKSNYGNFKLHLHCLSQLLVTNSFSSEQQMQLINRVTDSDDCFSKEDFFKGINLADVTLVLKLMQNLSKEALLKSQLSDHGQHNFGWFCLTALKEYFKKQTALELTLPKWVLKPTLNSQLVAINSEKPPKGSSECIDRVARYALLSCRLTTKNSLFVFKLVALLSNRSIVTQTCFKTLIKSDFFNTVPSEPLPKSFFRVFSRANLFSDTPDPFWRTLLCNLMYLHPSLIGLLLSFFSKGRLSYLLRMNTTLAQVDQVKPLPKTFFFKKSEFELIGVREKPQVAAKGKQKPPPQPVKEETFEDVDALFEQTLQTDNAVLHEDEKFDELTLENNKSVLLQDYGKLLKAIGGLYYSFFSTFRDCLKQPHTQAIQQQLSFLKSSSKSGRFFISETHYLLSRFLAVASGNKESVDFRILMNKILLINRGTDDSNFIRGVEFFIKRIDFDQFNITKDMFEILNQILQFVFDKKIDVVYKRKLFKFFDKHLHKFPEEELEFLNFTCRHFNELNFEEAFASFTRIASKLLVGTPSLTDKLLYDVLNYEDFVVRFLLRTLTDFSSQPGLANQQLTVLQLLKLLILTENEDAQIAALAKGLVEANSSFRFDHRVLDKLDFKVITSEFPVDMHTVIASLIERNFTQFEETHRSLFITTLVQQITNLVHSAKYEDEEERTRAELRYQLFPKLLAKLMPALNPSILRLLFEYVFGEFIRR